MSSLHIDITKKVWEEIWNQGKMELVDEIFSPDIIRHDPNRTELHGIEATKNFIRKMRESFPDLHITLDDVIAENNKVVTRYHFNGTHLGGALGFPATKRKVSYTGIVIFRFDDGKIVEQWTEADLLTLFQQLGVNSPSVAK